MRRAPEMIQAPQQSGGKQRRGNVLFGIVRLACFRADGLAEFTATRQGFLNSLAPLLAFPLVGLLLMLSQGAAAEAVVDFLATLVALLAPAVLSHIVARRWQREGLWLRYAIAFNWCQWAIPLAAMAFLLIAGVAMAAGLADQDAALFVVGGLIAYAIGLQWFIARIALQLSQGRAALFVVLVNLGTFALAMGPQLIAGFA